MLTDAQKTILLRLARHAILRRWDASAGLPAADAGALPGGTSPGLFVTLYKNGELRGCVGDMSPDTSWTETVERVAVESAFDDPRFLPLRPDEVPFLEIEISLLSPPRRVAGPDEVEPGRHGVRIEKGARRGVFLPQVWEDIPDREMFLNALCTMKAGLEERAWRDPAATMSVFTVEVVKEGEGRWRTGA